MISSMSVPVCTRFHSRRVNNVKMTSFYRETLFDALIRGTTLNQGHKILSYKTRVLGAAHSEDFVLLVRTVLIQLTGVTDRLTDALTMAKAREAFCCRA